MQGALIIKAAVKMPRRVQGAMAVSERSARVRQPSAETAALGRVFLSFRAVGTRAGGATGDESHTAAVQYPATCLLGRSRRSGVSATDLVRLATCQLLPKLVESGSLSPWGLRKSSEGSPL